MVRSIGLAWNAYYKFLETVGFNDIMEINFT